jgi:sulfide:quinone oxidoreductase
MIRTNIFKLFYTHTKFCIIGGGSGGLNLSTHMLRGKIDPKDIRIFDASEKHYYQPGWTMRGANLCDSELTYRDMKDVLPSTVYYTKKNVGKVDADKKTI